MTRPATSRLKCNPPLGRMPVLQFMAPDELAIDPAYQRSILSGESQALIRRIAQHWNWDLCQPLVVSRRVDGALYVIDGQHRLEAARLRRDIAQLPCVIGSYASAADEAASFVHLNQQRRPLTRIELFRAAVASEDPEATAILAAMQAAGLDLAPHQSPQALKPGLIYNIGGIEKAWRTRGAAVTRCALLALARGFPDQKLLYAGTLFPGIAAVCGDEIAQRGGFEDDRLEAFTGMLRKSLQANWRKDMLRARADNPDLTIVRASEAVMRLAWMRATGIAPRHVAASQPAQVATPLVHFAGTRWCDQCDMKVSHSEAIGCKSRWCTLKKLG